MKPIEIRLDLESVQPLLDHIEPILDSLQDELVVAEDLPEEDELLEGFWKSDLLESQRGEMDTIRSLFGSEFRETGRAVLAIEHVDTVIRACSAIRLKLRQTSLRKVSDRELELGEISIENLDNDERIGYGAYMLFASLQELAISQIDRGLFENDDGEN